MSPGDAGREPTPNVASGSREGGALSAGRGGSPFRRRLRLLLALACAALCFAGAVGFQVAADHARAADRGASVLYLPNEKLLKHATAGMNTIIADFLWLHCIQYVAIENRQARNFTWLETMVLTAVRLDPHFKDVYRYGSMFLSALKADAKASARLLRIGIPQNPRAWELSYELGMSYLVNRKDEPDARRYAGYYLGMSAMTGRAPQFVAMTASKLQSETNLDTVEQEMWLQMRNDPDKLIQELAERKLQEMRIREILPVLDQAAEIYRKKTGRWPETVDDIKREKIIDRDPPEPLGGSYFYGPDGKALSTTLLDSRKAILEGLLEAGVREYQDKHGHNPASLDDVVRDKPGSKIPPYPYPGKNWQYDPVTGEVT